MPTPRSIYEQHLRSLGADTTKITAEPSSDVGDFECLRDGFGGTAFVSARGVLLPDGTGDWFGFLQQGDAATVAARVVQTYSYVMAGLLDSARAKPPRVTDQEWALVKPPSLTRAPDGALTLVLWMGSPPGFGPEQLTITARANGPAAISRASAGSLASPDARVDALLNTLADTNAKQGQKIAADTLGEMKEKRAVPGLVKLLTTGTWLDGRRSAASALGKIGDPSALAALRDTLAKEKDPYLVGDLLTAIAAIGGPGARDALQQAQQQNPEEAVRVRIQDRLTRVP